MSTPNPDLRSALSDLANELDRAAQELNFVINGIGAAEFDTEEDTQFHLSTGACFLLMGLRDRMNDWSKAAWANLAMSAIRAQNGEGQL